MSDDTAPLSVPSPPGRKPRRKPVGLIDIGSNSVRLVVYDGLTRSPAALFNEKAVCALGAGMGASGRLNPQGVILALDAIGRFVALARAMEVASLDVLATAAVREASDGPDFVREVEGRNGITVQVLSGEQEARRAALGVLCSVPEADGMVADLGGGSLELVTVAGGRFGKFVSRPLGVLRLDEAAEGSRGRCLAEIDRHLDDLDWLGEGRGRSLYAVGGAWRSLARVCIDQMKYPLHVLDNFTLKREEAHRLFEIISRLGRKSLEQIPGVSRKRLPTLWLAAALLERLLERIEPARLVFSVYGMREGQFYRQLKPEVRRQDPLLAACAEMSLAAGRFPTQAEELMAWMEPLFAREHDGERRLRLAACLLGDSFWSEHPDYRALQAFLRVLRLPFMGLDHRDRARLALTVHSRYRGDLSHPLVGQALALLDEADVDRARVIGLALRLGHALSAGAPGLLPLTTLHMDDQTLTLKLDGGHPAFLTSAFSGRLEALAKALERKAEIA